MHKDQQKYEDSPKGKFMRHKMNAKRREIPFSLTFDEWWSVWDQSGKWDQRGVGLDAFGMSRIDDEGAYEVGNIEIKSQRLNRQEYLSRRWKKKADPFRTTERESAWDYEKSS